MMSKQLFDGANIMMNKTIFCISTLLLISCGEEEDITTLDDDSFDYSVIIDEQTTVTNESDEIAVDVVAQPESVVELNANTLDETLSEETATSEEIDVNSTPIESLAKDLEGEEIHCTNSLGDESVTGFIDFYDPVTLTKDDVVKISVVNTTDLNVNHIPISESCFTISDAQQLPIAYSVNYQDSDLILDYRHKATSEVTARMNLPAGDALPWYDLAIDEPLTYNNSTSVEIYDSIGEAHIMTFYYVKEAVANQWLLFLSIDGKEINIDNSMPSGSKSTETTEEYNARITPSGWVGVRLMFKSNGDLKLIHPESGIITESIGNDILVNGADGSQTITINFNLDTEKPVALEPTQFASYFEVTFLDQNGYPDSIDGYDYSLRFSYYSLLSDGSYQLRHQSEDPVWAITNGYGNIADVILTGVDLK